MAVNKTSQATRINIRNKTSYALPNNPTKAQMTSQQIKYLLGYLALLDTDNSILSELDRIVDETNGILNNDNTRIVKLIEDVGDKTNLTTTQKTNLVNAINEVVSNIGSLGELTTTNKATIKDAINELVSDKLSKSQGGVVTGNTTMENMSLPIKSAINDIVGVAIKEATTNVIKTISNELATTYIKGLIQNASHTNDGLLGRVDKDRLDNIYALLTNQEVDYNEVVDNLSEVLQILNGYPENKTIVESLLEKVDKTTKINGHALNEDVTISKGDVGLGNADNTSDMDKPVSTATQTAINNLKAQLEAIADSDDTTLDQFTELINFIRTKAGATELANGLATKVDKVSGKQLSTEDFTTALKNKLVNDVLTQHQDISGKVDKVDGKGLSTNDYDDTEKAKVTANTNARHSHNNKAILDLITEAFTTALKTRVDNAIQEGDSRLTNSRPASDVSSWAKASTKPSYSWNEITNKPTTFTPSSHTHSEYVTSQDLNYYVSEQDLEDALMSYSTNSNVASEINNVKNWITSTSNRNEKNQIYAVSFNANRYEFNGSNYWLTNVIGGTGELTVGGQTGNEASVNISWRGGATSYNTGSGSYHFAYILRLKPGSSGYVNSMAVGFDGLSETGIRCWAKRTLNTGQGTYIIDVIGVKIE